MAIDTPAKIAILGAGPIGLEAALYARFLGYDVEIFDRGDVAENVRRWGHVRLFTPFRMNASPLGLAALEAHDDGFHAPEPDEILTGHQWRERYLVPLSQTDLIIDHLQLNTTVAGVSRWDLLKAESIGTGVRSELPFRILLRERGGKEWETTADAVLDTTGVFGNPNWLGAGGAPAMGEWELRDRIEYGLPDVTGADRDRLANKHVLLVGCGHSAATTALALHALAASAPATRVTWVTRRASDPETNGPVRCIEGDEFPERDGLLRSANELVKNSAGVVTHWPGTTVSSLVWDESRGMFDVDFRGEHAGRFPFDTVIANVGYRPDHRLTDELQLQLCPATSGPAKLAAQLFSHAGDRLQQSHEGPMSLLTSEPDYYILGAKSYGRNPSFLVSHGLSQIRDVFTIIGDRVNLDLYKSAQRLPQ